jgi:hypothetical protein
MTHRDDPSKAATPLNYSGPAPVDDLKAEQQWEREHEAEQRRFSRDGYWMDIRANWKIWIVVVIVMTIFYGCIGPGGLFRHFPR